AITSFISNIIINLLLAIVSSIAIFKYNWNLGLISLLWIPVFLLIILFYHPKILKAQKQVMHSYSQNESNYVDTIIGVEAIKSNNKQSYFISLTKRIYSDYKSNGYTLNKIGLQYQFITEV